MGRNTKLKRLPNAKRCGRAEVGDVVMSRRFAFGYQDDDFVKISSWLLGYDDSSDNPGYDPRRGKKMFVVDMVRRAPLNRTDSCGQTVAQFDCREVTAREINPVGQVVEGGEVIVFNQDMPRRHGFVPSVACRVVAKMRKRTVIEEGDFDGETQKLVTVTFEQRPR